jgi:hypothetical protein
LAIAGNVALAGAGPSIASPAAIGMTGSLNDRPMRGLFFANFPKNDQPYSLRMPSAQTPPHPLKAGFGRAI